MKKLLLPFVLLCVFITSAQEFKNYGTPLNSGDKNFTAPMFNSLNQVSEYRKGYLNDRKIDGSPYVIETFTPSEIVGIQHTFNMRYNAYADEIEVEKSANEIYALKKESEFNTILINRGAYKLRLVNYWSTTKKESNGYLVEIASGNEITLFRRDKIELLPGKEAMTSFEITTQPKLIRMKARYFIGIKNNPIIAFPENKKQLINSFPNFKDQITNFIKLNDLDFDNETDLSKIALFLGTL